MDPKNSMKVVAIVTLCAAAATASSASTSSATGSKTGADARLEAALKRDLDLDVVGMQNYVRVEKKARDEGPRFVTTLGDDYAGSWIEPGENGNDRFVVAHVGPAAAAVHAMAANSGIELRRVRYSLPDLRASQERLNAMRVQSGSAADRWRGIQSWHVDPSTNSVTITATPAAVSRAIDLAAASGIDVNQVVINQRAGTIGPDSVIKGGVRYDKWSGSWCSIAFAVTRAAVKGFLTAGHCGNPDQRVWMDGQVVGEFGRSNFPGTDRAFVRVGNAHRLSPWVEQWSGGLAVRGSARAPVGAVVCRSGARTGYRCGRIRADNVTVHYVSGDTVYNMTESNACSGPGDSGGAWITPQGQAQGVHSGGTVVEGGSGTSCGLARPKRATFYTRINPILEAYNVRLVLHD